MGNQYTFTDDELSQVEEGVYETEQIIESGEDTFRVTLTKEVLPQTYNLDLFYEENEKLILLEKEYNKIMDERRVLFEKIKENKDKYVNIEVPEVQCFGNNINAELNVLINGKEETQY